MRDRTSSIANASLLAVPTLVVLGLVVVPLIMIFYVSFTPPRGDGASTLTLENYERFTTSIFMRQAVFSIWLAALVSIITLIFAAPFTYLLVGLRRLSQALWLIYILAQISLSEVLIAFAWQILLSRTTGITNIFVLLGLMDQSVSIVPSFWATVLALTYMSLPFAVLVLYPAFSRMDRSVVEAARTLGASAPRAFVSAVLPMTRRSLIMCGITVYILNLGAIIVPQLLGRPRHWTLAVHVTDQAIFQFNPPFAAALAVILLAISAILLIMIRLQSGRSAGEAS